MRSFELYLDESGKFIKDDPKKSPSLIGGILVKKGALSIEKAQNIMQEAIGKVEEKYVHINDISKKDKKLSGNVAVKILKQIKEIPAYIVIFENNELLNFNDDKLLYLNIMSEGIINLLEKLSLEKEEGLELNVIAARRKDLSDNDKIIIEMDEYSKRIKERIYMKIAEKNLFLSKNCKVNFELASARKNAKLMLSDVVCNSRLTRKSEKFNEEEKEFLENLFNNSKYMFNIFRTNIQKKLSEYLLQNNIVDAIFLINEVDDAKVQKELTNLIINNINTMQVANLRIQLELLSLKIRSIIDVQRNLLLCEKFLINIQENIVEKIKVKDFIINKLKLDVSLYLLTIYTHQGNNIKSKEQIEISKKELKEISGSWDFLEYYYILKTREAIYYNTCYNNKKTIEVLTEAIEKFKLVIETMEEIEEFGTIKSDILAKAVGTRLQAYTNLITPNTDKELKEEYYNKAVEDSEFAIEQFVSKTDKQRQYQYRCMLEISMGKFKDAEKYLMKVVGLNEINFKKFLEEVANIQDFSKHFIMVDYLELMANTRNEEMYKEYIENKEIYEEYTLEEIENQNLYNNNSKFLGMHPFEIIYWKLGQYLKNINKDQAIKYFNKAIEICKQMNEPAINILELAVQADKLRISKNMKADKQTIINKYKSIMEDEELSEMQEFLLTLKDEFEIIEIIEDAESIKMACKKISEEIKI